MAEFEPLLLDPKKAKKDPDKAQAELIKIQRKDFERRFRPLENDLMSQVHGEQAAADAETAAQKAGADVRSQGAVTRAQFQRDLARSGTTTTARQDRQLDRSRGLAEARGVADAQNTTRRHIRDENLDRTADLIGIGRDIQQGANEGLSAASGMQASREAASDAAKTAQKGQTLSMLSTGLGLAAAAFLL